MSHFLRRFAVTMILGVFASGCGMNPGYKKVDGKWCYVHWNAARGTMEHPLVADNASFVALTPEYAKDKDHVFHKMDIIPGADPASFQTLPGIFSVSKDKTHAYISTVPVKGADPATFQLLTYPYSRDKTRIYYGTRPMEVDNVDKFEPLKCGGSVFTVDGDILGDGWGRDGTNYYYRDRRIVGADYATFQITGGGINPTAHDKNRRYVGDETEDEYNARWKRDRESENK